MTYDAQVNLNPHTVVTAADTRLEKTSVRHRNMAQHMFFCTWKWQREIANLSAVIWDVSARTFSKA